LEELLRDGPPTKACVQCGHLIDVSGKYCNNCGARQIVGENRTLESNWLLLKQSALFYGIYIFVCAMGKFVDVFNTLSWELFMDGVLCATAVVFFCFNWNTNKKLFRWPNFSIQKLAAYLAVAVAGAFVVHYLVGWLNIAIFSKDEHYFSFAKGHLLASFIVVFYMAVVPAIFEEIGFRGYLLGNLLEIADVRQAVFVSAFLFGIIHLSLFSLFWLIPFALIIGYARIREGTLWYGICFHFCFNLMACLFELL